MRIEEIIKTINNARLKTRMTRKELALRSGLSANTVQDVCAGNREPTLYTLLALCMALRLDVKIEPCALPGCLKPGDGIKTG